MRTFPLASTLLALTVLISPFVAALGFESSSGDPTCTTGSSGSGFTGVKAGDGAYLITAGGTSWCQRTSSGTVAHGSEILVNAHTTVADVGVWWDAGPAYCVMGAQVYRSIHTANCPAGVGPPDPGWGHVTQPTLP